MFVEKSEMMTSGLLKEECSILNHKGTVELETQRLCLRKFKKSDAEDMFNNWANDPDVTRCLSWKPHGTIAVSKEIISTWANYADEKEFLESMFVDKILRISHIGSSAVPGLISKPTIDILLEISEGADLSLITEKMRDLGYIVNTPEKDIIE